MFLADSILPVSICDSVCTEKFSPIKQKFGKERHIAVGSHDFTFCITFSKEFCKILDLTHFFPMFFVAHLKVH